MAQSSGLKAGLLREYRDALGPEKIRLSRLLFVLALVLNGSFFFLDYWALPSALATVQILRVTLLGFLMLALLSTWYSGFLRFYSVITTLACLAMGLVINTMIFIAGPDDIGRDTYYGGLLLITFGLYAMTYIRLWLSVAISCLFFGFYLAISEGLPTPVLVSNLFFFVSTTVIGIVALSVRERYSRESFLLRRALQHDLERKAGEARLAGHLATHDSLTRLANRIGFEQQAGTLLERTAASGGRAALLFIDLDGFKPINDGYGHAVGDRVLKVVAERLAASLRSEDAIGRFGGDEFVACMAFDADATVDVRALVNTIVRRIDGPIDTRNGPVQVTASIGIAHFPDDGHTLDLLLERADRAMYRNKKKNRGKTIVAD